MYANGMALINLEKERTIVFAPEYYYEPQLNHALSWMQTNKCYALIVKSKAGKVDCQVCAVRNEDEELDLKAVSEQLLEIVHSWQ